MSLLEIVTFPDPALSKKARKVGDIDGEVKKLMDDMLETMYSAPGVGLAAPQIGVDKSVIVIDIGSESDRSPIFLADPEILESEGEIIFEEGCLSLPEFRTEVNRNASVLVRGINEKGEGVTHDVEGFLAVVFQHEIDHLNGILLVDKVSRLKRDIYKRKVKKGIKLEAKHNGQSEL